MCELPYKVLTSKALSIESTSMFKECILASLVTKLVDFLCMNMWTIHRLHLLTYSMVQSPSWEANWFAASQEIPCISRNPKVHDRTHKHPPHIDYTIMHKYQSVWHNISMHFSEIHDILNCLSLFSVYTFKKTTNCEPPQTTWPYHLLALCDIVWTYIYGTVLHTPFINHGPDVTLMSTSLL